MKKKTVITIVSSAVAVGLLGFAIYKYRKNKKQEENIQEGEIIEEEIPSEDSGFLIAV